MKIGVVVSATSGESQLKGVMDILLRNGCMQDDLEIESVPGDLETVLATRFFAELTEVDAVIVLNGTNPGEPLQHVLVDSYAAIMLDWNMPVCTTLTHRNNAAATAQAALKMVEIQLSMESTHTLPIDERKVN